MEHQKVVNFGVVVKRPYVTPQLSRFGAVRDLTQTGSTTASESNKDSSSGMPCTADWKLHNSCPIPSDSRVKENVVRIGSHASGIGLYLFDYQPQWRDAWGYGRQFGVMADEVETVMPEAVSIHPTGYRQVDYAMLGIERATNHLH